MSVEQCAGSLVTETTRSWLGMPASEVQLMQAAVRTLLVGLGEDVSREGLIDTPKRVAKALMDTSQGYRQSSAGVLGTAFFHEPIVSQGKEGLVLVRDIDFASTSEETLLPFHGRCHIAYVPHNGVVLGLSKLARLTKLFAKRMQTQERLGRELACVLHKHLQCQGTVIVIQAKHLTMTATRAIKHTTACVSGCFTDTDSSSFQEVLCMLGLDDIPPGNLLLLPADTLEFKAGDSSTDAALAPAQAATDTPSSSSSSVAGGRECPLPPPTPDLSDHLSETSIKDVLSDKSETGCTGSDRDSEPESDLCDPHVTCHHPASHHQSPPPGPPLLIAPPLLTAPHPAATSSGCCSRQSGAMHARDERRGEAANDMEQAVNYLISAMGETPNRTGLAGSARRYVMTLLSSTAGYTQQVPAPLYPPAPNTASPACTWPQHTSLQTSCGCQGCAGGGRQVAAGLQGPSHTPAPAAPAAAAVVAPVSFQPAGGSAASGCVGGSSWVMRHVKVPFSSQCEHHMLPFYGHVHVVYSLPGQTTAAAAAVVDDASAAGRAQQQQQEVDVGCVGGSGVCALQPPLPCEAEAIHQVVTMFTQRLQVQERITHQVADAVQQVLGQAGAVLVLVDAAHMCMVARGVENHAGHTTSMALRGAAGTDAAWRARALQVCKAAGIA